ncbi:hypothetical protein JTE90_003377 [Oedothorax gibbosus]|uniref:Uncharacterized protein n=1 Tax=Oedothorax gibbosus TaxID=931172 RepID=A0AAV6TZG1_9ARAC|nr:hypothetical protein JTE90_003377 [Oedothorax gibbosus]
MARTSQISWFCCPPGSFEDRLTQKCSSSEEKSFGLPGTSECSELSSPYGLHPMYEAYAPTADVTLPQLSTPLSDRIINSEGTSHKITDCVWELPSYDNGDVISIADAVNAHGVNFAKKFINNKAPKKLRKYTPLWTALTAINSDHNT